MVLDPIPQSLPVHFFGSRPQPPTATGGPSISPVCVFVYMCVCACVCVGVCLCVYVRGSERESDCVYLYCVCVCARTRVDIFEDPRQQNDTNIQIEWLRLVGFLKITGLYYRM